LTANDAPLTDLSLVSYDAQSFTYLCIDYLQVRHIPSPPRDVPPAPYIRDIFKASIEKSECKRHLDSDLVYPQLGALAPQDIASDLDYLFSHRRNLMGIDAARVGLVAFNPMGVSHAVTGLPGYDLAGVGMSMGIPEGNGRFPHAPFRQSFPPQTLPGQIYPGLSGPSGPRLTHHHSAPPGALPNAHAQMIMEQEAALAGRAGPGIPSAAFMSQLPAGMPINLSRRSISPVLVQPGSASGSALPGKAIGRNLTVSNSQSGKEPKRPVVSGRPAELDSLDVDKEWETHPERYKTREKDDRGRDLFSESHLERERPRERDRDYDREAERDQDRSMPHPMQRHPSHQHPIHLHPSSSQGGHHRGAHHHHVHHHHHHYSSASGPAQISGGSSSNVVALHPSNGVSSRNASPHPSREFERRTHSSAQVEVIDVSSKPPVSGPMATWKSNEDSTPDIHERSRRGIGLPVQDRVMSSNFPASPRSGPIVLNTPGPVPRSRRESWSTPDDSGQPRPSSSTSNQFPNANIVGAPRPPPSGSSTPRPQVSPTIPTRPSPAMMSPSRHNSIRLPPLSPSLAATSRSPLRISQALPGPSLPPVSGLSNPSSPNTLRRASPLLSRPKSPGIGREIPSQIMAGLHSTSVPPKATPNSPSVFPTSLPHLPPPLNSRLPINGTEAHLTSPAKVNMLAID
jgi:hypothetical protein